MALSREEVSEIAQACAQKALEGLHRYAVEYKEPQTIEEGLRDSMVEERTAADWYRRRGMDARLKEDMKTADLYEHVAKEEDKHYREFNERADGLISGNPKPKREDAPIISKITEKEARYGFLQLNEAEYNEALKSGRYPEPKHYEELTAYYTEPHEANWKGLSLAEMFPTKYKDLLEHGVPDKLSAPQVKMVLEEKRIPYDRGVKRVTPVTPEVKEPWQVKYYEELSIAEKQTIAQRADEATAKYIKTLPEYQTAIAKYNEWKKKNPYIFGTSGMMEEPIRIYQENYERFLKGEVLKDYPDLVEELPTAEAGMIKEKRAG